MPKNVVVRIEEATPPILLLPAIVNPLKSGKLKVVVELPFPQGNIVAFVLVLILEVVANVIVLEVFEIIVETPPITQDVSTDAPIGNCVVSVKPVKIGLATEQNTD